MQLRCSCQLSEGSQGALEPMAAISGREAGCALDRSLVCPRAKHSYSHSLIPMGNLDLSKNNGQFRFSGLSARIPLILSCLV